jgi:hypothetical protein
VLEESSKTSLHVRAPARAELSTFVIISRRGDMAAGRALAMEHVILRSQPDEDPRIARHRLDRFDALGLERRDTTLDGDRKPGTGTLLMGRVMGPVPDLFTTPPAIVHPRPTRLAG